MKKNEAIDWARERGWTKKDAERAIEKAALQFPQDMQTWSEALIRFAGPELLHRQHLQGAQRAQVTIRQNQMQVMAQERQQEIAEHEEALEQERSYWRGLLVKVYEIAQKVGFKDPLIEKFIYGGKGDAA